MRRRGATDVRGFALVDVAVREVETVTLVADVAAFASVVGGGGVVGWLLRMCSLLGRGTKRDCDCKAHDRR